MIDCWSQSQEIRIKLPDHLIEENYHHKNNKENYQLFSCPGAVEERVHKIDNRLDAADSFIAKYGQKFITLRENGLNFVS